MSHGDAGGWGITLPGERGKIARERAGSQETYTIRSGCIPAAWEMTLSSSPRRGGSTTITCGRMPRLANSAAASPASAQRNSHSSER